MSKFNFAELEFKMSRWSLCNLSSYYGIHTGTIPFCVFIPALTFIATVYVVHKECWLAGLNSGMSAGHRTYE